MTEDVGWKEATIWTLKTGALVLWLTFLAACFVAAIVLGLKLASWVISL